MFKTVNVGFLYDNWEGTRGSLTSATFSESKSSLEMPNSQTVPATLSPPCLCRSIRFLHGQSERNMSFNTGLFAVFFDR